MKLIIIITLLLCICALIFKNYKEKFYISNKNSLFNKVYVINLDRRKDRLKSVKKQLDNHGIKFERFSAYDGNNINKYKDSINKYLDINNKLNNGQIGCILSHIKVWENVINDTKIGGDELILILEDDILIDNNFKNIFNNFINKIKDLNYNMILLGLLLRDVTKINNDVYKVNSGYGTHAYLLTKNTMKENISLFKNINEPLDHFFSKIYKKNNVYIPKYNIIKQQRNNNSDIGPGENWEQFNNFKKPYLNRVVYIFWTGNNKMNENRNKCYESIKKNIGVPVILITPKNLHKYILKDYPPHPAYKYLSLIHKSDYLRTYFMHVHGGGYTDIKKTTVNWLPFFEKLESKNDKWCSGYTEIAGGTGSSDPYIQKNYKKFIGNCSYIFKPRTKLTEEWFNIVNKKLDEKFEQLKKNPGRLCDAQQNCEHSKYPVYWIYFLGAHFHDVLKQYTDKCLHDLPIINTSNYR